MNAFNKILLVIFFLLLGVVLYLEKGFTQGLLNLVYDFEKPVFQDAYTQTNSVAGVLFPNFQAAQVSSITISQGETLTTQLSKESEGRWVVSSLHNYEASKERVEDLLNKIRHLHTGDLLEEQFTKERDPYGVADDVGTRIIMRDASSNVSADFLQGRLDCDYNDPDCLRRLQALPSYVRKYGATEVYEIKEFPPVMSEAKHWLNRTLTRFPDNQVVEIQLEGPAVEGNILLRKTKDDWRIVQPKEIDANDHIVQSMARSFSTLWFQEIVAPLEDPRPFGLDEPQLKVRMLLENGEEHKLLVGNKLENNNYYASKEDKQAFVYIVHSFAVEDLMKRVDDLAEK